MFKNLLLVGLLCAGLGLAQRGGNRGGGGEGGDMPMPMGGANRLDTIAQTLNLTKDQKKAVKTMFDDGAKEAAPLRDKISKSRLALGEALIAKKSDEEVKPLVKATTDLSAQLSQLEMKMFGKIFASLDDTQKADRAALTRVLAGLNGAFHGKNWNEE